MPAEKIILVAGGTQDSTDAPATQARLIEPFGAGFDRVGNLFIVEMDTGNRLLKVDTTGLLTLVAGRDGPGDAGDGGPAISAQFNGPHNLAVLPGGDILISDTWNGRVRRVHMSDGTVSSVPGFHVSPDRARAAGPYNIALDPSGTKLYVADLLRIHLIDLTTGATRIVAGNGNRGMPRDGDAAIDSPLVDARAAAADRRGNLYILERNGHALRVVDRNGRIRTVVNASGRPGATGDGGDALQSTLNGPKHLCVDYDDNVIIADTENSLIRKFVPATGTLHRIAGTGRAGSAGLNGPPQQCELHRPHGVTTHPDGTLFITDSYNHRILRIVRNSYRLGGLDSRSLREEGRA